MVDPKELQEKAYVKDPVRIRIIDPDAIFITGILGESGRKLVKSGVCFYFEKSLAQKFISKGIALEDKETL